MCCVKRLLKLLGGGFEICREYCEGGSFMQFGAKTATKTSGQDISGILGVLEFAEADVAQNRAGLHWAENYAVNGSTGLMEVSHGYSGEGN